MSKQDINSGHFLKVIDQLPHSKSRVPYTYHHDYLREHAGRYKVKSRSDVAQSHENNDTELYAVALAYLLDELKSEVFKHIGYEDIFVCKKAKEITDEIINKYS